MQSADFYFSSSIDKRQKCIEYSRAFYDSGNLQRLSTLETEFKDNYGNDLTKNSTENELEPVNGSDEAEETNSEADSDEDAVDEVGNAKEFLKAQLAEFDIFLKNEATIKEMGQSVSFDVCPNLVLQFCDESNAFSPLQLQAVRRMLEDLRNITSAADIQRTITERKKENQNSYKKNKKQKEVNQKEENTDKTPNWDDIKFTRVYQTLLSRMYSLKGIYDQIRTQSPELFVSFPVHFFFDGRLFHVICDIIRKELNSEMPEEFEADDDRDRSSEESNEDGKDQKTPAKSDGSESEKRNRAFPVVLPVDKHKHKILDQLNVDRFLMIVGETG
jgi:hypothetical protein